MKTRKKLQRIVKTVFGISNKKKKEVRYFETELKRRDKTIETLKERNKLLLDTIVRQSKESLELKEKIKELNERIR